MTGVAAVPRRTAEGLHHIFRIIKSQFKRVTWKYIRLLTTHLYVLDAA